MSVVDLHQIEMMNPERKGKSILSPEQDEANSSLLSLITNRGRASDESKEDSGTDEEDTYLPKTYRIPSSKISSSSTLTNVMGGHESASKQEEELNVLAASAAGKHVGVTEAAIKATLPTPTLTNTPESPQSRSKTRNSPGSPPQKSPKRASATSVNVFNQSPKRVSERTRQDTRQNKEEATADTASETSSSEEDEGEELFENARVAPEAPSTSVEALLSTSSCFGTSNRPPLVSKENKRIITEPASPPKVKRDISCSSPGMDSSTSSVSSLSKPQPIIRQSALLSPRSQRRKSSQKSNRVSFADKDGGNISSHVTIDVSPNRLARRVKRAERQGPGSPDRSGSSGTSRVLVLLMDPAKKQYELTSISYSAKISRNDKSILSSSSRSSYEDSATMRTLLEMIPAAVSHKPLKTQVYTGFCRPNVGKEMVNMLTVEDYAIQEDEVLIAIPEGYKGSDCIILAKPILSDPRLVRLLKKLKRNEKKKRQRVLTSVPTNDTRMANEEKARAIEKIDRTDNSDRSWWALAKILSFLLVLCIFVKVAVDEEINKRFPAALQFEIDQFNLEQFNRDPTSLALGGWRGENEEAGVRNQTKSEQKNIFLAGIKEFVMSIDGDFI